MNKSPKGKALKSYGGYASKKLHDEAGERQRVKLGVSKRSDSQKQKWVNKNLDLSGK